VHVVRCFLIIMMGIILCACATSANMSQQFKQGKYSFQSGYYQEAFHELLPVAVNGNPEAQYAIGYMYYYGYGVPEDTESGIFWINKAAEQHYEPAIHALDLINKTPRAHRFSNQIKRQDALMHAVSPVPVRAPSKKMPVTKTHVTQVVPHLVPSISKKHYALQLFGSYDLSSVKILQSQLKLKNTGHVYQTKHNGRDWYVLTFGNFVTNAEASATTAHLPNELRGLHPWVRPVNSLTLV